MIQSLDRGIKILEILEKRKSAGVTEIAAELGINKSSAFRLIETLEANNLVEQDAITSKYKLSVGILKYSNTFLNNLDIVKLARPYIEKLVEMTQESAHLCVFSNNRVVVVDQVKSSEIIKVSASIGKEEVIYSSAVGKVMLAFLPENLQTRILDKIEFKAYTSRTITSRLVLLDNLQKIKEQGYAVDDEEMTIGVRCIAAPIRNHLGEVSQCIGISGPAIRVQIDNIGKYAEAVKSVADSISSKLGYMK